MRPQSAKAKGRKLQQWVRDKILALFPELTNDDVRSTSMGAGGEDVLLSPVARERVPCAIECKSRKNTKTLYDWFNQAAENAGIYEPVVIIKGNHEKPLALVEAEWFFQLLKDRDEFRDKAYRYDSCSK